MLSEKEITQTVELLHEENRFLTFKKWVFNANQKCSARNMAKAGFYFTGSKKEPDAVQCFLCEKSLDGWEPDDDPWAEHLRHSSNCEFAKLQKPEDDLMYPELLQIKNVLLKRIFDKCCDKVEASFDQELADLEKMLKMYATD